MKNNKGITLIVVILTVVLLSILGGLLITNGTKTYKKSQIVHFETYMKNIQKKVDILVESEPNYLSYGQELTAEQKNKLQQIINSDSNIETRNVNEPKLRYFSSSDIESTLELFDINDEFVINFANRDVISLNGVEKDNKMHYVQYTLN